MKNNIKMAGMRSVFDQRTHYSFLAPATGEEPMKHNFQFTALQSRAFSDYFKMTPSRLASIGAYIFKANESPCYPCRVSVLALSYEHHAADGPYRSSGPIFIRENSRTATPAENEVPTMLRHRLLSVRGYNTASLMIEADTVAGTELESTLLRQFENRTVDYIHIHNAGPGCFNCAVTRAGICN